MQNPLDHFLSDLANKIQTAKEYKDIIKDSQNVDVNKNVFEGFMLGVAETIKKELKDNLPETTQIEAVSAIGDQQKDPEPQEDPLAKFVTTLASTISANKNKPIEQEKQDEDEEKKIEDTPVPAPASEPQQDSFEKFIGNLKDIIQKTPKELPAASLPIVNKKDNLKTGVKDYVKQLDKNPKDENVEKPKSKSDLIKELVRKFVEGEIKGFKDEISQKFNQVGAAYGGGGGTNAVQYANGGTMNGDLNVTGHYLSAGVDLLNIFSGGGGGGGSQTLSFNEGNAQLSISSGNTVSLSALSGSGGGGGGDPAVNALVHSNSASWNTAYTNLVYNSTAYLSAYDMSLVNSSSAYWNVAYTNLVYNSTAYLSAYDMSLVNANSANWNNTYTQYSSNSASYATIGFVNGKFLPLSGGSITGNLVVQGSLTALGNATFANTIFTTTSALSVINTGPGPALYVFQSAGTSDVASFYDGDGVEVLHVGNANPGGNGFVGINESFPTVELSVRGAISASKTITTLGGNSNQWNSNYTTTNTNSGRWESAYTLLNASSANTIIDGGNTKGANISVGTRDGYALAIRTNTANRMWILSSGEVGIGPSITALQNLVNSNAPNQPLLTVSGIISARGSMIAPGGSSNEWNSAYTTTNTNSAAWTTAKINFNTAAGTVSNYTPSGSANIIIGFNSLASNSTNTAGSSANYNVAVGTSALLFLTAGDANVAIGTNSLLNATNIYNTVAVGVNALSSNTTTNDNTAIGTGSLGNLTSGGSNIAVGYLAGKNLINGNNNIFVGVNSSATSSVTASIALGRDATINSSNQLVIGSPSFPLTNNSIMYGGLSFTNAISTVGGNSDKWNTAYTNLVYNSTAYLSGFNSTAITQNSASWNTAYTNLVNNSANYLSGASTSYVNTNFVKLSGDTMTGTLSVGSGGNLFSPNFATFVKNSSYITLSSTLTDNSLYFDSKATFASPGGFIIKGHAPSYISSVQNLPGYGVYGLWLQNVDSMDPGNTFISDGRAQVTHAMSFRAGINNFTAGSDHNHVQWQGAPSNPVQNWQMTNGGSTSVYGFTNNNNYTQRFLVHTLPQYQIATTIAAVSGYFDTTNAVLKTGTDRLSGVVIIVDGNAGTGNYSLVTPGSVVGVTLNPGLVGLVAVTYNSQCTQVSANGTGLSAFKFDFFIGSGSNWVPAYKGIQPVNLQSRANGGNPGVNLVTSQIGTNPSTQYVGLTGCYRNMNKHVLARFTTATILTGYKPGSPLTLWIPPDMPSGSPIGQDFITSDKISTFATGTFPTGVRVGYFDAYVVNVSGADMEFALCNLMDSYGFENRTWPFSAAGNAGWVLYGGTQDTVHRPTFGTTGFYFEREPWYFDGTNYLSGGMIKNVSLGNSESYGNYSYGLGYRGAVLGDKSGTFAGDYNAIYSNNSVTLGGEGLISLSSTPYQAVVGKYNNPNNNALLVVGAGTSNTNRVNVLEVEANKVSINGTVSGNNLTTSFNTGSATGTYSFAEGSGKAFGVYSHAEGLTTIASGSASHAEGQNSISSGYASHAEGYGTIASGNQSHAEGQNTSATNDFAHAEGQLTIASGYASHAQGQYTTSSGPYSHAEGQFGIASGYASHTEGQSTSATNAYCHAEGQLTLASGYAGHAEGVGSVASGGSCHAEGNYTIATTNAAHAEGDRTIASGYASHSEGILTRAIGEVSHAAGGYSIAAHNRTWIWKGDTNTDTISTNRTDQFVVSAAGGIFFPGNVGIGTNNNTNALSLVGTISTNAHKTSQEWNTAYTNLVNNSTAYLSAYDMSLVNANSASWNTAYTNLVYNSASYLSGFNSTAITQNSANWNNAYTNLVYNSASYLSGVDISLLAAASGSWNSTYTTVSSNSARWNSVYTTVNNNSASWLNQGTLQTYLSTNNILLSSCTITNNLSVLGTIYSTTSAYATKTLTANIGDGVNTTYSVTHNFGTSSVQVAVYDNVTNVLSYPTVTITSGNAVSLGFSTAPALNAYRVSILGAVPSNNVIAYGPTVGTLASLAFAASDEQANITSGGAKIIFTIPQSFTLTKIKGGLNTAATGSSLIFSLSSQTNNNTAGTVTMAAGAVVADTAVNYACTENDRMCINVTQVGSTTPGVGLKVYLIGRYI